MRLSYMTTATNFNVTHSIRKDDIGAEKFGKMSILVDMKRKSPTIERYRDVVNYGNAAKYCEMLAKIGVDGFLINTDTIDYGGNLDELKDCSRTIVDLFTNQPARQPPVCICKDIIIHPIQIAQALEHGANGILLITSIVGADLEKLMIACFTMGVEPLIEVHSAKEVDYALACGGTKFLVNLWDRTDGLLYKNQAKIITPMLPMNAVATIAGNIQNIQEVYQYGSYGYDGIVLGRGMAEIDDIQGFIRAVHAYTGPSRDMGLGMKATVWGTGAG